MDNNTSGSRKLFLKPAKSGLQKVDLQQQQPQQQNGSSSSVAENGSLFSVNNNPFLKCEKDESEIASDSAAATTTTSTTAATTTATPKEKESAELQAKDLFKPPNTNLFKNATTLSENSNFVFGQNLHARVVIDKASGATATTESENKSNEEESKQEEDKSNELLFSSALSQQSSSSSSEEPQERSDLENSHSLSTKAEDQSEENLSLIEAARRYEEKKCAQKRKYEEVEVITGEEDDKNVIDMNCRLFTFDKNNWEERGRGMLRLNDCKNSARVVFRASGSLRLLLNTKVWRDQLCEQANSKSLKLTAFDTNGLVKIYLVTGRIEDIDRLYLALSERIRKEKDRTPEPGDASPEEDDEGGIPENDKAKSKDDDDDTAEPVSKKIATEV